jgi:hypothetical protein
MEAASSPVSSHVEKSSARHSVGKKRRNYLTGKGFKIVVRGKGLQHNEKPARGGLIH